MSSTTTFKSEVELQVAFDPLLLAARPFSLAVLPTANQVIFPLQQLACTRHIPQEAKLRFCGLAPSDALQPKGHGVIYLPGAAALTSSVPSLRDAMGKGIQPKVGPAGIK